MRPLAIAMNRLGERATQARVAKIRNDLRPPERGFRNSYIKQVASARFGVTSHYLVNAKELQIKMAQGLNRGEGGQLPGHKVDEGHRAAALFHTRACNSFHRRTTTSIPSKT